MRPFTAYVSKDRAGILADDPATGRDAGDGEFGARPAPHDPAQWRRGLALRPDGAGGADEAAPGDERTRALTTGLTDDGPPAESPGLSLGDVPGPARARAGSLRGKYAFLFSWRAVAAAVAVNILLAAVLALLMRLDAPPAPVRVHYIDLVDSPLKKPAALPDPARGAVPAPPAPPAAESGQP